MLNKLVLQFKQLPQLVVGFVCVVLAMLALYYNDPPTSLCDVQMQAIDSRLLKGFYSDESFGTYGRSVKAAKQFCISSNSPGGCHDLFERLNYFEKQVRTLPTECGTHTAAASIRSVIEKSLRLFAAIGWGDEPPADKYNKVSWLDTSDLGLFCRLKYQHVRLYGKSEWKALRTQSLLTLPKAETLTPRQQWERSLYSYPCEGLY